MAFIKELHSSFLDYWSLRLDFPGAPALNSSARIR
jgi:hypothetical protein